VSLSTTRTTIYATMVSFELPVGECWHASCAPWRTHLRVVAPDVDHRPQHQNGTDRRGMRGPHDKATWTNPRASAHSATRSAAAQALVSNSHQAGDCSFGTLSASATSVPPVVTQIVKTKGFDDSPMECPSQRPELRAST
jgi:hypothetical protein